MGAEEGANDILAELLDLLDLSWEAVGESLLEGLLRQVSMSIELPEARGAYLGLSGVAARAVQGGRLDGLCDSGPQSGSTNAERRSHFDSGKRKEGYMDGMKIMEKGMGRREEEKKGTGRELALDFLGFFHLAVLQPVRSPFGRPFTVRPPGNFSPNGNTEYRRAAGRSSSSPSSSVGIWDPASGSSD